MFIIYKLFHPLSKKIYIGLTHNVGHRLSGHLNDKRITKKSSWIKSLKNRYNDIPLIEILQNNIETEDWANSYEISWIAYYRNNYGFENVLNMTDGGDGRHGFVFSSSSRNKMSKSHLGQIAANRKIKEVDVNNIRELYKDGLSFRFLALEFSVNKSTIQDIVHNRNYKAVL